jgi:heptaprenylglyceryl phosphate synthase
MLPAGYQVSKPDAIAPWLARLLKSARRRRLQLGGGCDPAEATRREVAAAALALVVAVAIEAAEEVRP